MMTAGSRISNNVCVDTTRAAPSEASAAVSRSAAFGAAGDKSSRGARAREAKPTAAYPRCYSMVLASI